ncbi:MAG TPA: hypothetical protein VGP88_07020, partial [Thermoplasmata archaeon]|nr:hypothetical protein [Thermoplasmata archaeon]
WQVLLPNGNTTVFTGTGSFTVPSSEYSAVNASAGGTFSLTYRNPQQASVVVQLTVLELCPDQSGSTQTLSVSMQ